MDSKTSDPHYSSEILLKFLQESLPELDSKQVEGHLNSCHKCRTEIDRLAASYQSTPGFASSPAKQLGLIISTNGKRYTVRRVIAQGGMGTIYEAFDEQLQREIAIKLIRLDHSSSESIRARFNREARLASSLQHPGITPIHEMGQTIDGHHYIVMKLVGGETLRSILNKQNENSLTSLLDIFLQVCKTLSYAHAQEIVHRDLKPENIMVGDFGEVQVLDWGIAKNLAINSTAQTTQEANPLIDAQHDIQKDTIDGAVLGTPAYMSPEQAAGKPIGKSTDIYSLGIILAEILTGQSPFKGSTTVTGIKNFVQSNRLQILAKINCSSHEQQIVDLALQCIAIKPSDRPATVANVKDTIANYFSDRSRQLRQMELEKERFDARLSVEKKRRKDVSILAGIAVTVFACATIAATMFIQERHQRKIENHKTELASIRKRNETESLIRSALSNSEILFSKSSQLDNQQSQLSYLHEASAIIAGVSQLKLDVDLELVAQLETMDRKIDSKLAKVKESVEREMINRFIDAKIAQFIDRSRQPGRTLDFGKDPRLVVDIEQFFIDLGIQPFSDTREASEFLADFGQADRWNPLLRTWRLVLLKQNRDKRYEQKISWVGKLTDCVDPNQFRSTLRQLEAAGDVDGILAAHSSSKACDSLESAHLVADCLRKFSNRAIELQFLKRAQRKFPDDEKLCWRLASCHQYLKNYEEAITYFLVCHSHSPQNIAVLFDLCFCYHYAGQYDLCVDYGMKLLELAPNYCQAYLTVAISLQKLGLSDVAMAYCLKAISVEPKYSAAYHNLSLIAESKAQFGLALSSAQKAYQRTPRMKHIVNLARLQKKCGYLDRANEFLEESLEIHPESPRLLELLGDVHCEKGNYVTASQLYLAKLETDCYRPNFKYKVANNLIDVKQFERAANILLSESIESDDQQFVALANRILENTAPTRVAEINASKPKQPTGSTKAR